MKKIIIILLVILVGLFCLLCSPVCDTPRWRGPSMFPGHLRSGCWEIRRLCQSSNEYYEGELPAVEHFTQDDSLFELLPEQPLHDSQVYILMVSIYTSDNKFFYSPTLMLEQLPEDYKYVFACNVACNVEGDEHISSSSRDYHDYWAVASAVSAYTYYIDPCYGEPNPVRAPIELEATEIRSSTPPFPGCFLGPDQKLYYPADLLPVMQQYYPNLQVPEQYIIVEVP